MIFCDGGNPETLNQMHPVKRRLKRYLIGLLVLITVQMRELAVVRPWVLRLQEQPKEVTLQPSLNSNVVQHLYISD